MDAKRFDSWTRNRAARLTRRDALKLAGIGASSTALMSAAPALAQTPCTFTLHGEVAAGPSSASTFDGTLRFSAGNDGSVNLGSFTSTSGATAVVSGSITGRAVDLQLDFGGGETVTLAGAANLAGPACPADIAGVLTGPQPGDIGAWQATQSGSGLQAPVTAQSQPSAPSNGSTTGTSSSGLTSESSSSSTESSQTQCAAGSEACGGECVESCPNNWFMDTELCVCIERLPQCVQNQQSCQGHDDCCSGYCAGGTCFDCVGIVCGEWGCVDPNQDSNNCGGCYNMCPADSNTPICIAGACQCAPDGSLCSSKLNCCGSSSCAGGVCSRCPNPGDIDCGNGNCSPGFDIDPYNCGRCGNVCSDDELFPCIGGVCRDIMNDRNYCGWLRDVCSANANCIGGRCLQACGGGYCDAKYQVCDPAFAVCIDL